MKIEIGESLALSYLKHVKKCVLYQNNWKISSRWRQLDKGKNKKNTTLEEKIFNEIKIRFNGVFKSSFNQTIKQAEIDVLGMDKEGKIYAIDIAYHEKGLSYDKDNNVTINKMIKKLLRSYLILLSYFPDRDYEIIFASPKVGDTKEQLILVAFDKLRELFPNKNTEVKNKVEFKYISNEAFKEEILDKTIEASKKDSDTNELFMRSYKLLKLFDKISTITEKTIDVDKEIPPTASFVLEFETANEKTSVLEFKPSKEKSLEFEFIPFDEKLFKKELIKTKQAKITWFYPDRQEETIWNADKITENSKIRENIRNRKKVKAREKSGLYKVKLEII